MEYNSELLRPEGRVYAIHVVEQRLLEQPDEQTSATIFGRPQQYWILKNNLRNSQLKLHLSLDGLVAIIVICSFSSQNLNFSSQIAHHDGDMMRSEIHLTWLK